MRQCLTQITNVNGFDACKPDNARQNNYAWSMTELGDYIYVGTGRNIVYQAIRILENIGIDLPPIIEPKYPSNNAEIWRYNKCCGEWERVFKAPNGYEMMGFRYMTTYKDDTGKVAIYAAAFTITNKSYLLMSEDGCQWHFIPPGIPDGFSTRTMVTHDGKLYMAATKTLRESQITYLYVTTNPSQGWQQVTIPTPGPTGEIQSMLSFKGKLYIGTAPIGGFAVWRTITTNPEDGQWQLIVDKGAGDALNELPLSMEAYRGKVYVGTGIWAGIISDNPNQILVPPKGFDMICINEQDEWRVIIGSTPLVPTQPTTGTRNKAPYPSGFGNMFNAYCWQIRAYAGNLYIGTWDSSILINVIIKTLLGIEAEQVEKPFAMQSIEQLDQKLFRSQLSKFMAIRDFNFMEWLRSFFLSIELLPEGYGFDFIGSCDGEKFEMISNNGFCNKYNYGIRTLLASKDGNLYIGTANPFQGCEVWRMSCPLL